MKKRRNKNDQDSMSEEKGSQVRYERICMTHGSLGLFEGVRDHHQEERADCLILRGHEEVLRE